jgi:hypothetical protein
MNIMRTVILAASCLFALTNAATAQDTTLRDGFWIGFGFGVGIDAVNGINNDHPVGGSGYLRLGGTPTQQFSLGGEAIGWVRVRNDEIISRGNVMFVVMFFPTETSGFYLKGGVGPAGGTRVALEPVWTTVWTETGLGTTAGLGFDIRIGGHLYLTPGVDWIFQIFDSARIPFGASQTNTTSIFLFNLGLTWH